MSTPTKELTRDERSAMALATTEAMRAAYEAEGEEESADFDDAQRYLRDVATDEELRLEYAKWVGAGNGH